MPSTATSMGANPSLRYVTDKPELRIADDNVAATDYLNAESVITKDLNTKGHDTPHRITQLRLLLLVHGGPYGQLLP